MESSHTPSPEVSRPATPEELISKIENNQDLRESDVAEKTVEQARIVILKRNAEDRVAFASKIQAWLEAHKQTFATTQEAIQRTQARDRLDQLRKDIEPGYLGRAGEQIAQAPGNAWDVATSPFDSKRNWQERTTGAILGAGVLVAGVFGVKKLWQVWGDAFNGETVVRDPVTGKVMMEEVEKIGKDGKVEVDPDTHKPIMVKQPKKKDIGRIYRFGRALLWTAGVFTGLVAVANVAKGTLNYVKEKTAPEPEKPKDDTAATARPAEGVRSKEEAATEPEMAKKLNSLVTSLSRYPVDQSAPLLAEIQTTYLTLDPAPRTQLLATFNKLANNTLIMKEEEGRLVVRRAGDSAILIQGPAQESAEIQKNKS